MIRIRILVLAPLVLAACPYTPRPVGDDDDTPDGAPGQPDARIDAMPGDPCNDWPFTPAEADPCAVMGPTAGGWDAGLIDIGSGDWVLDGGTGELTDGVTTIPVPHATINGVAVFSVDHLRISAGATLRGTGAQPIAIIAWTEIDVSGELDVNSTTNGPAAKPGAGANAPRCPMDAAGPQLGGSSGNGDGGGGGGGFGAAGGPGGNGDSGAGTGGAGGFSRGLQSPPLIEGGCAGAASQGANGTPGTGGPGGGGIALIAQTTLAVSGVINAGGAGGVGATNGGRTGGGGGGSGGMIKLEAAVVMIDIDAVLAANGGQGGGGNDGNDATPGEDASASILAALVSNNEGQGTDGGMGGAVAAPAGGSAAQSSRGGGAGGGGVGYIIYAGHTSAAVDSLDISPAATAF